MPARKCKQTLDGFCKCLILSDFLLNLYKPSRALCDDLDKYMHLSVLFHMINFLTVSIEKQKSRKCFYLIFDAETAKVVLILSPLLRYSVIEIKDDKK